MKVKHVIWITGNKVVGIVIADNSIGETNLYISAVEGLDEKEDTQFILDWGVKMSPDSLIEEIKKYT